MSGKLNNAQGEIIRQLLIQQGIVSLPTTNQSHPCYYTNHPDTPNDSACLHDTAPVQHGRTQPDMEVQEYYGVQFAARCVKNRDARQWCEQVARGFDLVSPLTLVTLGSYQYLINGIQRTSGVVYVGFDPVSRRRMYTVNALCSIRMLSSEDFGTGT